MAWLLRRWKELLPVALQQQHRHGCHQGPAHRAKRLVLSKLFQPLNLREDSVVGLDSKSDELTCKSQRLMMQAGLIYPSSPGCYCYMPYTVRAMEKLVKVIDQEMQAIGGQKLNMPSLSSAELWRTSGRWDLMGKELFRLADRHSKEYCLGPTHEETITDLIASQGNLSYKQLPLLVYQITRKFRDEPKPRFGLLRSREFYMKDMYTFDTCEEAAHQTYSLLLHMPQAKRLPKKYSMIRLLKGLTDPDPVIRALCVKGLITMADWPGIEIKDQVPAMINSLCGVDGRLVVEALADVKKIFRGLDGASYIGCIIGTLKLLFDDERVSVRSAAISLFGKMIKKMKKSQVLMKEEEILDSLIPLLLHLQEGNPDMAEKCKNALDECSRLLEWRLPKQVGNRKAWHNHQEGVDEICHYFVKKHQENVQRWLFQSQRYLSSTQPSLRKAAAMFIGFLVMHMDNMMSMKDLDLINNALEGLIHDPEASVCIFAAQAHERVLAVYRKLKYGLVEQHKVNSESAEKHKSLPNTSTTQSTSSMLLNALNLWKLTTKR